MKNDISVFLSSLLAQSDHVYYSKNKEHEEFYFYPNNLGCTVKVTAPQVNGVKILISYRNDKTQEDENLGFYVADWKTIETNIQQVIEQYQYQRIQDTVGEEGLSYYDKYIKMFKEVLQGKEINGVTYQTLGKEEQREIEILEHNKRHILRLGRALSESENKITTLLGCYQIIAVLETEQFKNHYNHTHRVFNLIIPGYEIEGFPILNMESTLLENDFGNLIIKLKNIENQKLKSGLSYILLSEELDDREINVKKLKI